MTTMQDASIDVTINLGDFDLANPDPANRAAYRFSGPAVNDDGDVDMREAMADRVMVFQLASDDPEVAVRFVGNPDDASCGRHACWLSEGEDKPSGPYGGSQFSEIQLVSHGRDRLTMRNANADSLTYTYTLRLEARRAGGGWEAVEIDPRIINR